VPYCMNTNIRIEYSINFKETIDGIV